MRMPTDIDGLTAMAIATAMAGQWQRRPGERDTEKVKRIYKVFAEISSMDRLDRFGVTVHEPTTE